MLLLLPLSPNSLGKGLRTSRGTGEPAPQGTYWHLQVKANKPVDHIEEEEGHWENNARVVIQAEEVDAKASLIPGRAIAVRAHAEILPDMLEASREPSTGGLDVFWVREWLDRARHVFLPITSFSDDLTHKHLFLLASAGTGQGTGAGTTNGRL